MDGTDRNPPTTGIKRRWARFLGAGVLPRLAVILVAVPLLIWIAVLGGLPFRLLVLAIVVVGLREFHQMTEARGYAPFRTLGLIGGLGLGCYMVLGDGGLGLPLTLIIVALTCAELLRRDMKHALAHISVTLFGIFYVAWLGTHLVLLRELEPAGVGIPNFGLRALAFAVLITWVNDSLAYVVGVSIGRHKLWPRVSPKKSIEGAVGGLVGAAATGGVAAATFLPIMPIWIGAVLGLTAGVVGQVGDLVESLLKRDAGIKDSAALLPGHGGVLDRFDSLFFVSPLVYYLMLFLVR